MASPPSRCKPPTVLFKPIVGLARVGYIRAKESPRSTVSERMDWYDYVAQADLPTVVVLQDLDATPGYGAWWAR